MTSVKTRFQQFTEQPSIPAKLKVKLGRYKQDEPETAEDHKTYQRIEEVFKGKYEPIGLFRRGGMGSVYFAFHRGLKSLVLVKTLDPEQALIDSRRKRFQNEAIVTKKIKHPGIVEIYDLDKYIGTERDETNGATKTIRQDFIVMEHVPGLDLNDKVEQLNLLGSRLTDAEIAKIGLLAAKALGAAHRENVIHRDIKPGNIMLIENGEVSVKIIDFGIARDDDPEDREIEHTMAGEVFGTCHYMPPEQASGHKTNHRADIYSLGAVLYELAERGRPPFEGETRQEVMMKVVTQSLPPITNSEISDRLKGIIYRAMSKEPSARYQTMEELARELDFGNTTDATAESIIGKRIIGQKGEYVIQRQIGLSRDTGAYFIATVADATIKREVTIKITPPNANSTWRERARKELETLARINHPNIARPIDVRETNTEYDIVFDFVPQASLRELDLDSLDRGDRISIAIQTAEALKHAHLNGIIHRDIKPGSIFVEPLVGSSPVVKVANFGFAKEMAVDTRLTIAGAVVGTENAYMSPEQQAGSKLNGKTDVYSFGLVLRELVFGIKPDEGRKWVELKRAIEPDQKELYELIQVCIKEKSERPDMNYISQTLQDIAAKQRISRLTPPGPAIDEEPTGVILHQVRASVMPAYPSPTPAAAAQAPSINPNLVVTAPEYPVTAQPNQVAQTPSFMDAADRAGPTEETVHNLDIDSILGRKRAGKAKTAILAAAGIAAIGIVTAAVGVKINNSNQKPREPRIETIMRDASPVIAVPTLVTVDAEPQTTDASVEDVQVVAQDAQVAQMTTRITINANVSGYRVYLPDGTQVCSSGRNSNCQFEINTTGQTQLELRKGARRIQLTIDAHGSPVETNATFPRARRRFDGIDGL